MYNYIKGTVTEIKANNVTLEVFQIGYQLFMPNPFRFKLGQVVCVYVYQRVTDDAITLFGFASLAEKELFLKLISVNGIGPKSACAILASGSVDEIAAAIETGNAKYLQKFPGIGPKASQQIILDLQGKIDLTAALLDVHANLTDVDEALQTLGYNVKEIKKVLGKLDPAKDTGELIKDALKMLLK